MRRGRPRIVGVITPYHRLLDEAIGSGNVSEIAREWGLGAGSIVESGDVDRDAIRAAYRELRET